MMTCKTLVAITVCFVITSGGWATAAMVPTLGAETTVEDRHNTKTRSGRDGARAFDRLAYNTEAAWEVFLEALRTLHQQNQKHLAAVEKYHATDGMARRPIEIVNLRVPNDISIPFPFFT